MWSSGTVQQTEFNANTLLSPGQSWTSVDGVTALRIESDGEFSVYRTDVRWGGSTNPNSPPLPALWKSGPVQPTPTSPSGLFSHTDGTLKVWDDLRGWVWQSTTATYPNAKLVIQHDGDVVIKDANGNPAWRSNTATRDAPEGAVGLAPGATLGAGSYKTTLSGRFRLIMQTDGNLVVYDLGANRTGYTPIWASNTVGSGAVAARMVLDGTLALLDAGQRRVWPSPLAGRPGMFLALQEDGNLVAYEPAQYEVWSANTDIVCVLDDNDECYNPPNQGGHPGAFVPTFDAPPVRLRPGDAATLQRGGQIVSETGRSKLVLQSDGNLVYILDTAQRWASYTSGLGGTVAQLTSNGDLVVLGNGSSPPIYSAGTDEYLNSYLTFTDDGRLSIYRIVSSGADGVGFSF